MKSILIALSLLLISTATEAAPPVRCASGALLMTAPNRPALDAALSNFVKLHSTVSTGIVEPNSYKLYFNSANDATYALLTYRPEAGVQLQCFDPKKK
jgi:hypothetical protein